MNKKYIIGLGVFLIVFWVLYDFILMKGDEFKRTHAYTFENKTVRDVARSMSDETQRLLSGVNEKQQVIGFVHLIERNRYLLYNNEISLESFYDFVSNILFPFQKIGLKKKSQYTYQLSKYLRRLRKTRYEYVKYEMSDPEFYYEDHTRNAVVSLVRTSLDGNREFCRHHFRQYKDRYYLYLK